MDYGERSKRPKLIGPCQNCGSDESLVWRRGPPEKPVLCNDCGSRFAAHGPKGLEGFNPEGVTDSRTAGRSRSGAAPRNYGAPGFAYVPMGPPPSIDIFDLDWDPVLDRLLPASTSDESEGVMRRVVKKRIGSRIFALGVPLSYIQAKGLAADIPVAAPARKVLRLTLGKPTADSSPNPSSLNAIPPIPPPHLSPLAPAGLPGAPPPPFPGGIKLEHPAGLAPPPFPPPPMVPQHLVKPEDFPAQFLDPHGHGF